MSAATFRRDVGVTEMQYNVLRRMKDGEIQRRDTSNCDQSLHLLVKRGILEYVPMHTDSYLDDYWRLTALGREFVAGWS